jgi:hypothetical protein
MSSTTENTEKSLDMANARLRQRVVIQENIYVRKRKRKAERYRQWHEKYAPIIDQKGGDR